MKGFLAIDIGASSGKSLLGVFNGKKLELIEIHRFPNIPVEINGYTYWDILYLYNNVLESIKKAAKASEVELETVGIDTWGVDFGLLDKSGFLLGNPFHYRNMFKTDVMERVIDKVGKEWIFKRAPAQFKPFNTLYQLIALKEMLSPYLKSARTLLMIPSLLSYFLTGKKVIEFTIATTTQLYNPHHNTWDKEIMEVFGIPDILPRVVPSGTILEIINSKNFKWLKNNVKIVLPASHDTGSAVASIPDDKSRIMFISIGTWAVEGVFLDKPMISEKVIQLNFANEGCYDGCYRLLQNITGLWLIQGLLGKWKEKRHNLDYKTLEELAKNAAPFQGMIDPDSHEFQNPDDMEVAIIKNSRRISGKTPQNDGEIVRIALEGIALKTRLIKDQLEMLTGKNLDKVHMIGGGVRNRLLCQLIANATNLPVETGPIEGTAIGSIIIQMIAAGYLKDLKEGHEIIRRSFDFEVFEPQQEQYWNDMFAKWRELRTASKQNF